MQTTTASDIFGWLGRPAYAVAAFLSLSPFITIYTGNWPLNVTDVRWRYDAETGMSGFVVAIVMGLLLASIVGAGLRHRVTLRVFAVLYTLLGAGFVGLGIDYMLDGLQLRGAVDRDRVGAFELLVSRGVVVYFVGAFVIVWLGIASYRAAKQIEAVRPRDEGHPLVSI